MRRRYVGPLTLLACGLAAGGWWAATRLVAEDPTPARLSEVRLRNRDIAFYAARTRRDPKSAVDLAFLAGLFLQRARETGDYQDFRRAEDAARRSLALRADRNGKARLVLASSLLGQHRFVEALRAAEELCALEPWQDGYRALLAEIQLELGRYDEARATFGTLARGRANLAVAPRLARWMEIQGRPEEARYILARALAEARRRTDLPHEQIGWFYLRMGDFELRNGRLKDAERALRGGLAAAPGDPRLLAALARLEAARGRWEKAIAAGERAIAAAPDIATLALLGDAYAAAGDSARAESYFAAAERAAAENPEPFNRAWTLFRLEHGRELEATRAILEQEITVRQDVYGFDQLAWARYLTGDHAGARAAMAQALRMGTEDAVLFLHAGMIERAIGELAVARRHLGHALALNPCFHPRFAPAVRAPLDSLTAPSPSGRYRLPPALSGCHAR